MAAEKFRESLSFLHDVFRLIILGFIVWAGSVLKQVDSTMVLLEYRMGKAETRIEYLEAENRYRRNTNAEATQ